MNVVSIDPFTTRFSQCYITRKSDGNIEIFNNWDENRYYPNAGNIILVVQFDGGFQTSFNNSRIFIARKHKRNIQINDWTILADLHHANEELCSPYLDMIERYQCELYWKVESRDGIPAEGVYKAIVKPKNFGGLIVFRCAQQGESFPLEGFEGRDGNDAGKIADEDDGLDIPLVSDRNHRRRSAAKFKGDSKSVTVNRNYFELLREFLRTGSADDLYLSNIPAGMKHRHRDLFTYLKEISKIEDYLDIESIVLFPERTLVASVDGQKDDDFSDDDDELLRLEAEAEAEMRYVWEEHLQDFMKENPPTNNSYW